MLLNYILVGCPWVDYTYLFIFIILTDPRAEHNKKIHWYLLESINQLITYFHQIVLAVYHCITLEHQLSFWFSNLFIVLIRQNELPSFDKDKETPANMART